MTAEEAGLDKIKALFTGRICLGMPLATITFDGSGWLAVCPSSATFDTAEALRLELVAAAPAGVTVDVEIAAGSSEGSAEDEAGRRLFASERRERMT